MRSVVLTWDVRVFLVLQTMLVLGYPAVTGRTGPAVLMVLGCALTCLAAVLWATRARWERGYRLAVAGGLLLLVTGALVTSWIRDPGQPVAVTAAPFPWVLEISAALPVIALALCLGGGLTLLAAVLGAGVGRGRISRAEVLDTLGAGTGLVVFAVHAGVLPSAQRLGGPAAAAATAALAILLAAVAVVALWSLRPARLVHPGALLVGAGSVVWLVLLLDGGVTRSGGSDPGSALLWYLPLAMFALACRWGLGPVTRGDQTQASRRMLTVGGLALVGPVGLLASALAGEPVPPAVLGLATVVPMAALLVRVVSLLRTLEDQASHDGLTGLLNRQAFEERAEAHLGRHRSGSVVLIDLDGFKRINDDFGHAVGDAVLSAVSARLSDIAPPGSLLARHGGDEFVMFLPLHTMVDADVLARALDSPFAFGDVRLARIPASIGIAVADADFGTVPPAEVLDQLLTAADAAMYGQKTGPRRDLSARTPHGVVTHLRPTVVASPRSPAHVRTTTSAPAATSGSAQARAHTVAF